MFTAQRFTQLSLRQVFQSAETAAAVLLHLQLLDEVLREAAEEALVDDRAWEDPMANGGLFTFWTLEDPDLKDPDALKMALTVLGPETVTERAVGRLRREARIAAARWSPTFSAEVLVAIVAVRDPRIVEALHARFEMEEEIRHSAEGAARTLLADIRTASDTDQKIEAYTAMQMLAEIAYLPAEVQEALFSILSSLPKDEPPFYLLPLDSEGFRYEPHDEARQVIGILLSDRELAEERLVSLVPWALGLHFGRAAGRVALHPKAGRESWMAILDAAPAVVLAASAGLSPEAWKDKVVRERLEALVGAADQRGEGAMVRYYLAQGAPEALARAWWPEILSADPELALSLIVELRPELGEGVSDAECEQLLASEEVRRYLLLEDAVEEDLIFEEDQDQTMAHLAMAPGAAFAFRLIERWGGEPPRKKRAGSGR